MHQSTMNRLSDLVDLHGRFAHFRVLVSLTNEMIAFAGAIPTAIQRSCWEITKTMGSRWHGLVGSISGISRGCFLYRYRINPSRSSESTIFKSALFYVNAFET